MIRLEVEDGMDKRLLKILKKEFSAEENYIYKINGPLDLTFLMKVNGLEGFDHLKYEKYIPQPVKELNHDEDIFYSDPPSGYCAASSVSGRLTRWVDFVRQASKDPNVLCYQAGRSTVSAAIRRLLHHWAAAAENGKQVTVLVELKARFDEENNIQWARVLEKAGCPCHLRTGRLKDPQ